MTGILNMIIKNLLISEKCFYLRKTLSLNLQKILALIGYNTTSYRGAATGGPGGPGGPGGQGAMAPSTLIFEPNKVQQFQFQTSGIMLFMGVHKLYGPKILQFYQVCYNI